MKKLMISLDKNILNKDSIVANRMIEYGKENELFIIIPSKQAETFDLSQYVHVVGTGGNKLQQFFRLKKIGKSLIADNSIEFITTQDPFFLGKVGVWLKKYTRAKTLEVQLHGDFYSSDYYKKSGLKNWIQYYIGKRVLKYADKIRVVGRRIRESLVEMGIDRSKIDTRSINVYVGDFENWDKVTIDLHEKYTSFKKIFLVPARMELVKNIHWLIDLWRGIPLESLLLVVGEGSQERVLKQRTKERKNIRFEPWTDEHVSYIKTADCVLFPSLSEGYGLVPMEAHALGTTVIMNDVGVANYELQSSDKVKIISVSEKQKWIDAILQV